MRIPKKLKLKFEGSIIIVGVGVGAAEVDDLAVGGALGACVAGVSDIVIIVVVIGLFFWRTPLRLVFIVVLLVRAVRLSSSGAARVVALATITLDMVARSERSALIEVSRITRGRGRWGIKWLALLARRGC